MKKLRKTLALVMAIAMLMSMTVMSAQAFYDVPGSHPNAEAVNRLAKEGAISGVGDNLYAPDEEVNRGMAVTVLGRLAGAAETESDRFSDVEPNSWYSGYVGWAVDNGIVNGGTDGLFHPYDTVTGEQLNLMISRYAALVGKTVSLPAGSSAPVTRGELAQRLAQLLEEPKMGNIGVVQTESGLVSGIQGDLYEDITLFKGVPFAAPPVGDLRWHEPVDAEPWDGVRVCDTEGDAPLMPAYVNMLFSDPSTPWIEFYPDGAPSMSEDCLYLNIATPAQSADEKLPVVIWFHGGGFQNGYYYEAEFDPEVLASKGCVVVSVGMRLGIFGFFALPQLSEDSGYGASGNYGMMDCIKGTQWVIDNIANFGGDPNNITLMGQSGGSSKVTGVLVSPMMEGKIAGTINQSALNTYSTYATLEQVEQAGQRYLGMLGLDADISVEELRALDADFVNSMSAAGGGSYRINIDGKYFTESPRDFYLRPGQLDGLNMMFGNVYGEAASGIQIPGASQPSVPTTAEDFYAAVRAKYGDELCDKYKLEESFPVTDWDVSAKYVEFATKEALAGNRIFATIKDKQNEGGSSYIYTFGRVTPGPRVDGSELGWHSGELWYVFGSFHRETAGYRDWQRWDYAAGEVATTYWSNFIKTGDPNGVGVTEWPEASDMSYQYIDWHSYSISADSPIDQMIIEYTIAQNGLAGYLN